MHELSITRSLMELVLEKASNRKTVAVNVVVGEWSGIVDECMKLYFQLLSQGTPAEGAVLNIRRESPKGRCNHCEHEWQTRDVPVRCPGCESDDLRIQGGATLMIESIEVEDEHTCSREYSQS